MKILELFKNVTSGFGMSKWIVYDIKNHHIITFSCQNILVFIWFKIFFFQNALFLVIFSSWLHVFKISDINPSALYQGLNVHLLNTINLCCFRRHSQLDEAWCDYISMNDMVTADVWINRCRPYSSNTSIRFRMIHFLVVFFTTNIYILCFWHGVRC